LAFFFLKQFGEPADLRRREHDRNLKLAVMALGVVHFVLVVPAHIIVIVALFLFF
jgi:hypothetical protein